MSRQLIVTADDFGADIAVNEAVEQTHRHGLLTAASLMVAGYAAGDAVARARRLPRLGVGLHIVLVEGRPVLPPERLPDLVDATGRFRSDMARMAVTIFAKPAARRQVAAEIEAQFRAFAATGLPLDHVNAHKHFHLHPTIAGILLEVGRRYGMRAIRTPVEPHAVLARAEPRSGQTLSIEHWWANRLRRRMRAAGMLVADQVFGLRWSGAFTADRLRALLSQCPPGLSEFYFHPATADVFPGHAPGYAYRAETAALLDAAAITGASSTTRGCWRDFEPGAPR